MKIRLVAAKSCSVRTDGWTYKQAYRQMDRYDEARCRFSQFCEQAYLCKHGAPNSLLSFSVS